MKLNKIKLLLVLFLVSCAAPKKDMQVEVFVKDLKKGILYLERVQDSILVAVDSVQINKERPTVLEADLNHPELFYVLLDRNKADDFDNRIPFFGELFSTQKRHASRTFCKGLKKGNTLP